ncbi:MAG TPA: class I SAM-dependent methyltransferase [Ktedonobacterales bacterium]
MKWLAHFRLPTSRQWTRWPESNAAIEAGEPAERNPLDTWHNVALRAFGANALAPIANPQAILDVACGTGRWARAMARAFPQARVEGFDVDTEQIDRALEEGAWRGDDLLPPKCRFVRADALRPFLYPDASFDYVHLRYFSPFLPAGQLLQVLGEMTRVTRPGGWVEIVDAARFEAREPARQFLLDCLRALYERNGLVLEPGRFLADYLRQAGLRAVKSRTAMTGPGGSGADGSDRLSDDLLAGMVRAAPHYIEVGIASELNVRTAIEQAHAAGSGDTSIRATLAAAWGQRATQG